MCGINFTMVPNMVEKMNNAISHRGIRSRTLSHKDYHLGHVRLPIQGVSQQFDQPWETDDHIFLFAGEIFNYKQLMPEAESDIQVLVKFWNEMGEDCFDFFDGFWSAIIVEKGGNNIAHVFTDFLAYKPLYLNKKNLSISSEMKSLIFSPQDLKLNPMYFSSMMKWGYCLNPLITPFVNIEKIPHNIHLFITKGKNVGHKNYMKVAPNPHVVLRTELETSVSNRLVSDIPVSLLCSGGLDSSIIYKLMEKKTHDFTLFHVGTEEEEYLNYLEIPSDIKVVKLPDFDLAEEVDETMLYFNECPVDLGSVIPQWEMSLRIKDWKMNVAISGDGADELFGGYKRTFEYDSQYSDIYEELINYHLPRLDKLMMANTIELRCPFLSKRTLEFALSLRYDKRIAKNYLKEIFADIIPKPILEREKFPLKSKIVRETPPIELRRKNCEKFVRYVVPMMQTW